MRLKSTDAQRKANALRLKAIQTASDAAALRDSQIHGQQICHHMRILNCVQIQIIGDRIEWLEK